MVRRELLEETSGRLHDIENHVFEAHLIVRSVLKLSPIDLALSHNEPVSSAEIETVRNMVERRLCGEPLQYILGTQEFMGIEFFIDKNVLIPRADTETLAETVLSHIGSGGASVLDLCCGSGCIALSLAHLNPRVFVRGIDISEKAIEISEKNCTALNLSDRASFEIADLLSDRICGKYDVIVSNPPYIRSREIDTLMREVRDFEPKIALDGGSDGLVFYRRIAEIAPQLLNENGFLALEVGYDQAEEVSSLLSENFCDIQIIKDLCGVQRVVCARLSDKHKRSSDDSKINLNHDKNLDVPVENGDYSVRVNTKNNCKTQFYINSHSVYSGCVNTVAAVEGVLKFNFPESSADVFLSVEISKKRILPPPKIRTFVTAELNKQAVSLSWDKTDGANAYIIWRKNLRTGEQEICKKVTDNYFYDENVTLCGNYTYSVCALYGFDFEGAHSQVTVCITNGKPAPAALKGVCAKQYANSVKISFPAHPEAASYNIYRTLPTGENILIANTKKLYFTDFEPVLQYAVRAVTASGLTNPAYVFSGAALPAHHADKFFGAPFKLVPGVLQDSFCMPLDKPHAAALAKEAAIADINGDGKPEIIIKWLGGESFLDAYSLSGKLIWRISLGRNMPPCPGGFCVGDFNGDLKAEICAKTADASFDGMKNAIGDRFLCHKKDDNGYPLEGSEFLTLFDGSSAKDLDTVFFDPPRGDINSWGGIKAAENIFFCCANNEKNLIITCRGGYLSGSRCVVCAYEVRNNRLIKRWRFDALAKDVKKQADAIYAADIDSDGRDELIFADTVLDHDAKAAYPASLPPAAPVGFTDSNKTLFLPKEYLEY